MPFATAVFAETGRHWFWTHYSVVQEDDQWAIQDMIDVGANAFQLSEDELHQRISDLKEQVVLAAENEEGLDDDDDDDDLDDFEDEEDENEDEEDEEVRVRTKMRKRILCWAPSTAWEKFLA